MINAYLLSLIEGYSSKCISEVKEKGIFIEYFDQVSWTYKSINIYELANKCKEWAFTEGFILVSYKEENCWYCDVEERKTSANTISNNSAKTEPEAIFNSCEFIFKERL